MSKDTKVYGLFGDNITDSKDVMKGQVRQLSKGMNHLFIIVLKDFVYLFLSSSLKISFIYFYPLQNSVLAFGFLESSRLPSPISFSIKMSSPMSCSLKALILSWAVFSLIYRKDKVIMLHLLNSSFLRIMTPLYLLA